jgi:hypothetical protein
MKKYGISAFLQVYQSLSAYLGGQRDILIALSQHTPSPTTFLYLIYIGLFDCIALQNKSVEYICHAL